MVVTAVNGTLTLLEGIDEHSQVLIAYPLQPLGVGVVCAAIGHRLRLAIVRAPYPATIPNNVPAVPYSGKIKPETLTLTRLAITHGKDKGHENRHNSGQRKSQHPRMCPLQHSGTH